MLIIYLRFEIFFIRDKKYEIPAHMTVIFVDNAYVLDPSRSASYYTDTTLFQLTFFVQNARDESTYNSENDMFIRTMRKLNIERTRIFVSKAQGRRSLLEKLAPPIFYFPII